MNYGFSLLALESVTGVLTQVYEGERGMTKDNNLSFLAFLLLLRGVPRLKLHLILMPMVHWTSLQRIKPQERIILLSLMIKFVFRRKKWNVWSALMLRSSLLRVLKAEDAQKARVDAKNGLLVKFPQLVRKYLFVFIYWTNVSIVEYDILIIINSDCSKILIFYCKFFRLKFNTVLCTP